LHTKIKRLLAILVIICFTQVIGEFIVRIFSPQVLNPSLYIYDQKFAFTLKKDYTGFSRNLDYSINLFTNSNGFRCDKNRKNTISKQKILVVGDSYSFGTGVEYEESYPEILQSKLHTFGVFESNNVLNTGIPAWGTSQELLMTKYLQKRISPEIIIWQICENDFDNNIQYGLHTIREDSLIYNSPKPTKRDKIRSFTTMIPFYDYFAQNSHLINLYRKSLILLIGGQLSKQIQGESINHKIDDELYAQKWLLMKKITKGFIEIGERQNIELIPIFIPSGGQEIEKYGNNPLVDSLLFYLDQNHIKYVDFTYLGFNKDLRFSSDGHWKPKAHALAADSLCKFIIN